MKKQMERKVTRIGNSMGISMTEALKLIGADIGDYVTIEYHDQEIRVRKKHKQMDVPQGVDPELFDVLKEGMTEYHETLKALKDR